MEHQDWKSVTFSKPHISQNTEMSKKVNDDPEKVRLEPPKQLGTSILNARTAANKTQKELASHLGISTAIVGRWETNKEIPTNLQIAKIEKFLKVKLQRCKKVAAKDI